MWSTADCGAASRAGVVGEPVGVLEDYGAVAEAFCAVHQLTGEGEWLDLAGRLLDTACVHFVDTDGGGGFFDTADDAERLVARPSDPTDNATPAGLSVLAAALVTYTGLTGETKHRDIAVRALETVTPIMVRHPRYAGYSAAVAEAVLSGPYEVAIAGPDGRNGPSWPPSRGATLRRARWSWSGSRTSPGSPYWPGGPPSRRAGGVRVSRVRV
jgi:uncharacterized protein YyaL (SSP411 family)